MRRNNATGTFVQIQNQQYKYVSEALAAMEKLHYENPLIFKQLRVEGDGGVVYGEVK
jgi:hypothetical protein